MRGPQSEVFLQGQVSQDLTKNGASSVWSLVLEPNGDVLSTALVTPVEDGYDVVVARELGEATLARLRRFHLRVACTLDLEDALSGPFNTLAEQIDGHQPGPHEFVHLSPQCYGAAFVERTVSFTKGCFTGQELVGRLDARASSVPWRFVTCEGPNLEALNTVLRARGPSGPSGVTSAIHRGAGVVALGFLHRSGLDVVEENDGDVKVSVIA